MTLRRGFARWVARLLIGVVLTAQLAVSAYACPGLATIPADALAGSVSASPSTAPAMPDCENMGAALDPAFANLCAEHCRQGDQHDPPAGLALPAALFSALYSTPPAGEPKARAPSRADPARTPAAPAPPHTLLHCCFRI